MSIDPAGFSPNFTNIWGSSSEASSSEHFGFAADFARISLDAMAGMGGFVFGTGLSVSTLLVGQSLKERKVVPEVGAAILATVVSGSFSFVLGYARGIETECLICAGCGVLFPLVSMGGQACLSAWRGRVSAQQPSDEHGRLLGIP